MFVGSLASMPRTIDPWNGDPSSIRPYQSATTTVATPCRTIISTGCPKIADRPTSFG